MVAILFAPSFVAPCCLNMPARIGCYPDVGPCGWNSQRTYPGKGFGVPDLIAAFVQKVKPATRLAPAETFSAVFDVNQSANIRGVVLDSGRGTVISSTFSIAS
jgi:hypothetical protein